MPRIFDNIDQSLLPALRETLAVATRADFSVGYFNLRGWKQIDALIDRWSGGPGHCCRLLVGMQRLPKQELQEALTVLHTDEGIDNQKAIRFKKQVAEEFRDQLMLGAPTADEAGLRRLAGQLRSKKVQVKLFLRHPLHAKLYLLFRPDPNTPTVGYVGSSNLTFAGLAQQGELNIDVVDQDAGQKLARWFEDRWDDRWCIDISQELLEIIAASWAGEAVERARSEASRGKKVSGATSASSRSPCQSKTPLTTLSFWRIRLSSSADSGQAHRQSGGQLKWRPSRNTMVLSGSSTSTITINC